MRSGKCEMMYGKGRPALKVCDTRSPSPFGKGLLLFTFHSSRFTGNRVLESVSENTSNSLPPSAHLSDEYERLLPRSIHSRQTIGISFECGTFVPAAGLSMRN